MNKNSNTYQILYAAVMVLLVGSLLALIYMALKPKQNENIANDTRKQILSALHIAAPDDSQVKETYEKYIIQDLLVDPEGNIVDSAQNVAFDVDMKKNVKLAERQLPVMKCKMDDGSVKYVLPVYGAGLWGPIWGYVAVNDDGNTIYGANFSHEGETPGLGARIADKDFQDEFVDKHLFQEGEFKGVNVTFKKDLPKTVTDVLMDQAVAKVKAMNPEYIDDGNGGKVLAFKGADGAIMRNPETSLKPYTANELIIKELSAMGVLETGRQQTGTGTKEVPPTYSGANTDISGAKTQNEATEIITRSLLAQGITIASKEFEQKKNEIWTANQEFLKKLPIA